MGTTGSIKSLSYEIVKSAHGASSLKLIGRLDFNNTAEIVKTLLAFFKKKRSASPTLDLTQINYMDDFGAQVVFEIEAIIGARNGQLLIIDPQNRIGPYRSQPESILDANATLKPPPKLSALVRLGEGTMRHAVNVRFMISFIGSALLCFLKVVIKPKSLRLGDTLEQMERTGVDALPIVALISFLLGLIMAFMSALQLRQFGANIYIASLVAMSMVSELGPIMTAIVVAGRSGSAYAAEIGTMKISEEIDAIYVMGYDPTLFLAIPRIVAAFIVVPLLTLFADLFAIAGGLVIGVTMLDLSMSSYINQTIQTLTLFEFFWGMAKSAVFAIIVAWTGCLRGFQAQGGAAGVGHAATSAVVSSIFLIILFDSVFAVMRSYW
jgi:phospholipid/cholesterol/gamma-HCH transport system permease protein